MVSNVEKNFGKPGRQVPGDANLSEPKARIPMHTSSPSDKSVSLRASTEWDCRNCPVASDLLRMLDYLTAENAGLRFRNMRLRRKLAEVVQ